MEDYNDAVKSRFNAGVAFAERIDSLQRAINSSKFNPLMRNMETGTFNFEVMIVSANCLVVEGWDKFNPKEKELMVRYSNIMNDIKKKHYPISFGRNGEMIIDKINYDLLLEFFDLYERKIKEVYGKHSLNNPDADDDDGL